MRINYREEIRKALEGEFPYDEGGLFHSGIVLSCQTCQNSIEEDGEWISKAEINECLDSYLTDTMPDYSNILFPTGGCKEVIRRAKYYIQYHLKKAKWERKLTKRIGYPVEVEGGIGIIRLRADEIDRRVKGFRRRAEKYVAGLKLPIKIKKIHLATYWPPMREEDFRDERMKECFVKKTPQEIKRDKKKFDEAMKRGEIILSLESPYRMVRYAGINIEFELPDEVKKDFNEIIC